MTIDEAAKRWNVTTNTVCKYLAKGWIGGISCKGNIITLPDIPKPISRYKKNTTSNKYMSIITACNKNEYISAYMLDISSEDFSAIIQSLVSDGYLQGNSTCGFSNVGYSVTANCIELLKKSTKFNFTAVHLSLV